jgi:hypothetical protein
MRYNLNKIFSTKAWCNPIIITPHEYNFKECLFQL